MQTNKVVSDRIIIVGLIIIQLISFPVVALLAYELYTDWHDDSVEIYYHYSTKFFEGEIPYRDYDMEYPPLALLAFSLPHVLALGKTLSFEQYLKLYLLVNALFSLIMSIIMLLVLQRWYPEPPKKVKATALLTIGVLLCAPILPFRYDLFPALLSILALYLLIAKKPAASGFSIGVAVGAKLYPAVIIPIMGLYFLAKKDIASLVRFIVGGLISILTILPFYLLAPNQFASFLTYHQQRGLEIETLISGLILLLKTFGVGAAEIVYNYTAFHLSSPYADIALRWLPFITIILFVIILANCYVNFRDQYAQNRDISTDSLNAYTTIAVLVFIATNKVFSPQYIIWVLPFLPLLKFRYASLLIAIYWLTNMLFPAGFGLLLDMHTLGVLVLNLRNGLLATLLLWMLIDYTPLALRLKTKRTLPT